MMKFHCDYCDSYTDNDSSYYGKVEWSVRGVPSLETRQCCKQCYEMATDFLKGDAIKCQSDLRKRMKAQENISVGKESISSSEHGSNG